MSAAEQALESGDAVPLSLRGPAPTRVVAGYGFWLFLLSDIIIFAALFAAYAVLSGETAAGLYPLESVMMMDRIIREAEASVTQLPRPERSGPLAASQIEFLTAQLPRLVKQDLRRVHRVGAIGRIGQIQFVIKGQPMLQHLRPVEVGTKADLAKEQDARLD